MRLVRAAQFAALFGTAVLAACSDSNSSSDPATAGVRVTVVTEGSAPDPNGYTLSIDGGPGQRVGINATISLGDLAVGSHRVVLDDLAANCQASAALERTVELERGEVASVDFTLVCAAAGGIVRVEIVTSGPDADRDGYMVSISGLPTRVLSNARIEIRAEEGERQVAVTGVATNCAPSTTNPSSVMVLANRVVTLRLEFSCTANTGAVDVVTVTTGGAVDPDGYQVLAEGAVTPVDLGLNGSVVFPQLLEGSRSITLSGIQANCAVAGGATRAVNVVAAGTVQVRFEIRCTVAARLTVTVATTATGSMPAGFTASAESTDRVTLTAPVASNGSVTFELPFFGEYSVSLRTTPDCGFVRPAQVVAVDVPDETVSFTVTCRPRRSPS